MDYTLVDARYVKPSIIWVRFDDGVEGEIDLKPELYGPVFEPLAGPSSISEVFNSSRVPYTGVGKRR